MGNSCVYIPDAPNGEASKLFQDIQAHSQDRETAKVLWAFTQTELFQSEFDDLEKDENGEITYEALDKALGLSSLLDAQGNDRSDAVDMGIIDGNGKPVTFDLAKKALQKAAEFNAKSRALIANVVENNNGGYTISITDRTPLDIAAADSDQMRAEVNTALIKLIQRLGFNVEFVDNPDYEGIFNPKLAEKNADLLKTIIQVANGEKGLQALPEEAAHLILAGLQGHPIKTRIDSRFTPRVVRHVLGSDYKRYYKKYKNGKTPIQDRLRDEAEGKVLAALLRGDDVREGTLVTAAPFFRQELTTNNKSELEEKTGEAINAARNFARKLGLNISSVNTAGGVYQGKSEISYVYNVASQDKSRVDLLAALLGDLGYEYQDAVISANYVNNKSSANATEIVFKAPRGTSIEDVVDLLGELGIEGATYHFGNNNLNIIAFSESEYDEILEKFKDTKYEYKETNLQDSRYLDNESRRNLYETWLNSEMGQQNGELHNAISKALAICNAAARQGDNESERIAAAQDAADKWDAEHQDNTLLTVPTGIINLMSRAWNWAKTLFSKLTAQDVDEAMSDAKASFTPILDLLSSDELGNFIDREAIMKHEELYDLNAQTEKLADTLQKGEQTLSQRLSILERMNTGADLTQNRADIELIRDQLDKQQYTEAAYSILRAIGRDLADISTEIESAGGIRAVTTNLQLIFAESGLVNRLSVAIDGYTPFLELLASMDTMRKRGDINVDEDWAKKIENDAESYIKILREKKRELGQMRLSVLTSLFSLYYGDNGNKPKNFQETDKMKWQTTEMILTQAQEDISAWDTTFFSAGRSRNPLINVLHKIVVDQQAWRDNKINKLKMRMQEAAAKLHAAGHSDSEFMEYDKDGVPTGYFVSKWKLGQFQKDYQAYMDQLNEEELTPDEYEERLHAWQEQYGADYEHEYGTPDADGNRTHEFMPKFKNEDGTYGKYANPDFQKGWDDAMKEYYKTMMDIKADMDALLPYAPTSLYAAPQVRKSTSEAFDKNPKRAATTVWNRLKDNFIVREDDAIEYGEGLGGNSRAYVKLGFNNKPIKTVPVYFTQMLDDMNDLSTDTTMSMFNYIAMAVNYSEMSKLANAMRLLQEHITSDQFEVIQTRAGKPMWDAFPALGRIYRQPYVKSGEGTRIAKAVTEYIDRMFFGETKQVMKDIKIPGFKDKSINSNKLFDFMLKLVSYARLGLNPLSGAANITQGEIQMIAEASTGKYFNLEDYMWAKKEYAKLLKDYLADFNSIDRHDRLYLLINQFNSSEDFFRDVRDSNFNKSALKRIVGKGNIYFFNSSGEHEMHSTAMLAMLHHEKVKVAGTNREETFYDSLKEVHDENGWHLEPAGDIEFVGNTNKGKRKKGIKDRPFLQNFRFGDNDKLTVKKEDRDKLFVNWNIFINRVNQGMFGGYSEAEKGNWNAKAWCRLVLQFRQWMFETYDKAYSKTYYDSILGRAQTGGVKIVWDRLICGTIHDMKRMGLVMALNSNKLTPEERQLAGVAYAQAAMMVFLLILTKSLGKWKDDDSILKRGLLYTGKRGYMELAALLPSAQFVKNIKNTIQSPAAAFDMLDVVDDLANFFSGPVQSGRFKGWNRQLLALWRSTPLYNVQKLFDLKHYSYMFNIFN